jgi:DNA-binding NarL/FixJ family response regulator
LSPKTNSDDSSWRSLLTPREQDAAVLLAKGDSNKEIARQLDITERTVKAHVGAMLEKLGVRDRLQLSLIINGIEKTR